MNKFICNHNFKLIIVLLMATCIGILAISIYRLEFSPNPKYYPQWGSGPYIPHPILHRVLLTSDALEKRKKLMEEIRQKIEDTIKTLSIKYHFIETDMRKSPDATKIQYDLCRDDEYEFNIDIFEYPVDDLSGRKFQKELFPNINLGYVSNFICYAKDPGLDAALKELMRSILLSFKQFDSECGNLPTTNFENELKLIEGRKGVKSN